MRDITDLIGRIFLSAIFIFEAIDTTMFFGTAKRTMSEHGLTWNQDFLLYGAIFLLTLGGLMVLIGYRTTLGSILLLIYWVPVTLIVHDFWNTHTNLELRQESIMFMKNFAIIGGLLMLIGKGGGRYSIRRLFATTRVG
ncbi:MAG TPA: DoxX family protein [Saprospiraceae bacterium]|nr:DoxX family protein [Saprospiraceae bacterium]